MQMTAVRRLVEDVLATVPKPYAEDVVDEVFHAIEQRPEWRRRYDELAALLGKKVVDSRAQFWIANYARRSLGDTAPAKKSKLIESYTKLDKHGDKRGKKRKEPEALKTMSDYYQTHRAGLPHTIAAQREVIVEMLMEGYSPEEAFARAV